jgi:hypothetical protein
MQAVRRSPTQDGVGRGEMRSRMSAVAVSQGNGFLRKVSYRLER